MSTAGGSGSSAPPRATARSTRSTTPCARRWSTGTPCWPTSPWPTTRCASSAGRAAPARPPACSSRRPTGWGSGRPWASTTTSSRPPGTHSSTRWPTPPSADPGPASAGLDLAHRSPACDVRGVHIDDLRLGGDQIRRPLHEVGERLRSHVSRPRGCVLEALDADERVRLVEAARPLEEEAALLGVDGAGVVRGEGGPLVGAIGPDGELD